MRISELTHAELGADLAAAKFVIGKFGGKIQDETGSWITRVGQLPKKFVESFKVTAIELTNSNILTEGLDNFAELDYVKSLNLSRNKNLDDFACDIIAREFRKSRVLESIDLSFNEQISVHGLNALFRIPSIRHIRAVQTGASKYENMDLFALLAEDERQCKVVVSDDETISENTTPPRLLTG